MLVEQVNQVAAQGTVPMTDFRGLLMRGNLSIMSFTPYFVHDKGEHSGWGMGPHLIHVTQWGYWGFKRLYQVFTQIMNGILNWQGQAKVGTTVSGQFSRSLPED